MPILPHLVETEVVDERHMGSGSPRYETFLARPRAVDHGVDPTLAVPFRPWSRTRCEFTDGWIDVPEFHLSRRRRPGSAIFRDLCGHLHRVRSADWISKGGHGCSRFPRIDHDGDGRKGRGK